MWLNLIMAGCLSCSPAIQVAAPETAADSSRGVTLTETQPEARIQLPSNTRSSPAAVLEVPVVRISNPDKMSFSIFVYLEWCRPGEGPARNEKILVGNFTVFPPDRTGRYTVRTSTGFERLKTMGADLPRDQVVFLLEMKRTNPNKPWSTVVVEIAPLDWRSDSLP